MENVVVDWNFMERESSSEKREIFTQALDNELRRIGELDHGEEDEMEDLEVGEDFDKESWSNGNA